MQWFFNKTPIDHVVLSFDRYPAKDFDKATRSTVPLLSWLFRDSASVEAVFDQLHLSGNPELHLEYTARPAGVKGRSSQTDAMVIDGTRATAIEAKWTESEYDTVGKWLCKGSNPENRKAVLKGWLKMIQPYSLTALTPKLVAECTNQMIHRAASACMAGESPQLAYVVFTPRPASKSSAAPKARKKLELLWGVLGQPNTFPFYLIEVPITPTDAFHRVQQLPQGPRRTTAIKAGIVADTPLFAISAPKVVRVGA